MHHPTDRITHTTALVTPVVEHWLEGEIAQWVHPMKDRSDDPSLLPRSYISLHLLLSTCASLYSPFQDLFKGLRSWKSLTAIVWH